MALLQFKFGSMTKVKKISVEKRIKVVFFDEAVAFGGSVVVLAHLFNHIDRSRFQPLLVSGLDEGALHSLFRPSDVFFHFRRRLNYVSRLRWMQKCPSQSRLLRKLWVYAFIVAESLANLGLNLNLIRRLTIERPDLVHNNNDHNALRLAQLLGIPVICHLHGPADAAYYALPEMRRARRFISISDYMANLAISRGMDAGRVVVIPNPAPQFAPDLSGRWQYLAPFGVESDQLVIGHVGRVVRWKGQLEFLRAFKRATLGRNDVVALIVGDDNESFTQTYRQELEQYVADNALTAQVKFTGHSSEVLRMMSYCDIVVHSSIEPEPFGLVITEAMAAGAAVIAAKSGAPSEIIDDMVNGLLIDPIDTADFARALSLLITDDVLRRNIAVAGKRMVEARYSPELFARKMEDVYMAALSAS